MGRSHPQPALCLPKTSSVDPGSAGISGRRSNATANSVVSVFSLIRFRMSREAVMQGLTLGGRYRLDRLIGRGGMGEVWSGTDLRLRRAVAVKVLARELAADQNAVARFRREAETAAALQHPGIAVVFDVDVHVDATGQTLFLVMELLDGRDLRTLLDGAPAGLPIAQAVSFGTQIAE